MRVFVAVLLPDKIKTILADAAHLVRAAGGKGAWVREENYHLTLAFIGEANATSAIEQAMRSTRQAPLELAIGGLGRFKRKGGDILYASVNANSTLSATQSKLADNLRRQGYSIETRAYTPHITLARKLRYQGQLPNLPQGELSFAISGISLMQTLPHKDGGVYYEELFYVKT